MTKVLDLGKLLSFVLFLGTSGCGGGGTGMSSGSPMPASKHEFLYAISSGQIQSLSVNTTTGMVSALAGLSGSIPGPPNPGAIVADPLGRFIYVSDVQAGSIRVFNIEETTGRLSPGTSSPFSALRPRGMVIDSTGKFLFVANSDSDSISTFLVDSSGALTPVAGSPFPIGASPTRLAIDSTNTFLFANNSNSAEVSTFIVNSAGALTPFGGPPSRAPGVINWLAIDPSRKFLFASSSDALSSGGAVVVFAIGAVASGATGGLVQIPTSPFLAGRNPQDIVLTPDRTFLYVANRQDDTISAFSIGTTSVGTANGILTQLSGSPFAVGSSPVALAIDTAGRFLYVANSGAAEISVMSINSATGLLTRVAGSPFGITKAPQDLVLVLIP
jgi:6-phosphogluconolactonase